MTNECKDETIKKASRLIEILKGDLEKMVGELKGKEEKICELEWERKNGERERIRLGKELQ